MPPSTSKKTAPKKAPAPPRCVYREGARRCVRAGTGNPALCRAHRAVLEQELRGDEEAGGLGQVIADFMNGREIRPDDALRALGQIFAAPWQARPAGAPPGPHSQWDILDPTGELRARMRAHGAQTGVPPGVRPPPGARRPPPRPPVNHESLERQRALLRARQELGFEPRAPITKADVERRRKEMARKHHPDLGGSVERMASINQAADLLLEHGNLG